MYLARKPISNAAVPQEDLDELAKWEISWKVEFYPQKCYVMPITETSLTICLLHGQILETVSQAKYLGVIITSDILWYTHTHT